MDGYTLNPGDLSWEPLEDLGEVEIYERTAPQQVIDRCREAQIIVTNKVAIRKEVLEGLPALRYITVTATGYDVVDVEAARSLGIPVSNVPEYGTDSVAQFTMALILELCHRVGLHDEAVKAGEWSASPDWSFWKTPQVLLRGKIIGIVGFGRIGRRVGELANALGMEVVAYDVKAGPEPPYRPFRWVSLEELFSVSDVVTLHCPQTPENRGFVGRKLLGRMKPNAFFINAARGGLVEEESLAEALREGRIAGAALDVVSQEPIRPENPLLGTPNCIITPHMAWATREARQRLLDATVENIKAFISGRPINVVS